MMSIVITLSNLSITITAAAGLLYSYIKVCTFRILDSYRRRSDYSKMSYDLCLFWLFGLRKGQKVEKADTLITLRKGQSNQMCRSRWAWCIGLHVLL